MPLFVPGPKIDTVSIPNPLGSANPGTGSKGAMPSDATLPMPGLAQLADVDVTALADGTTPSYNAGTGKFKFQPTPVAVVVPLWMSADNAVCTLPRGQQANSTDYGQTPGSGVEHFTYFRADKALTVNTIRFQTGKTNASGSTLARVGLYTVSGNTKTLVASCANKTTFGTANYQQQNCALTASYTLVPGTVYAIGVLQVATTPSDFIGAWFNGGYMGASPAIAHVSGSGKIDLLASSTDTGSTAFPIYYELVN